MLFKERRHFGLSRLHGRPIQFSFSHRATRAASQQGQIIILTLVALVLGTGFLFYSMAEFRSIDYSKDAKTELAVAQVKEALIGWSASRTPTASSLTIRPGELPCPDMNNNGLDDDGNCSAGAIGRVPWKTLGIPEPLDGYGQTLWYAVAGPFRLKNMSAAPITSDTLGNLVVYQGSSATTLTNQAIAVLIAPGPPVGTQARGATMALCSTTGTTIQQSNCAANYLEATGGGNNAQTAGPFIQAAQSPTFNDRVLVITNADLMPVVEQRVAREMMVLLKAYYDANGVYPWADLSDGNSNGSPDGYNRGRVPCGTARPTDWASGGTPALPDWLTNGCPASGWTRIIYYAVGKNRLEGGGSGCSSNYSMCSAPSPYWSNNGFAYLCPVASSPFACSLTNVSSGNADVILITPGASDGSSRSWPASYNPITGDFEDTENSDNDDDQYAIPSSSNDPNRDRMFNMR